MRYLFIHQNFLGQFGHVSAALAARGHEVVALGVNQPVQPIARVRHVLYRGGTSVLTDGDHLPAHPLVNLQHKLARGEAAARAMQNLRQNGFVPDIVVAHPDGGRPCL